MRHRGANETSLIVGLQFLADTDNDSVVSFKNDRCHMNYAINATGNNFVLPSAVKV